MFQLMQPMQTVLVGGQEPLFIPHIGSTNQLNGVQPILMPNAQNIQSGVMPANILHDMGQIVSLPTDETNKWWPQTAFDAGTLEIPVDASCFESPTKQSVTNTADDQIDQTQQQQQFDQNQKANRTTANENAENQHTMKLKKSWLSSWQQAELYQSDQQQNETQEKTQVNQQQQTITITDTNIQNPSSSNGQINATNQQNIIVVGDGSGQNVPFVPVGVMPPVFQIPAMQETVPVQVPIIIGNGQTILETFHIPFQVLADQIPGLVQPQMQIFSQQAQVANFITTNGQIQPVQTSPINQLQIQCIPGLQTAQVESVQQQNVVIVQPPLNLQSAALNPEAKSQSVDSNEVGTASDALVQSVPNTNDIQSVADAADSQQTLQQMSFAKLFKRSVELSRHSKIHTGEKHLECSEFNEKFNRGNRFRRHIRMHTKRKNTEIRLRELKPKPMTEPLKTVQIPNKCKDADRLSVDSSHRKRCRIIIQEKYNS